MDLPVITVRYALSVLCGLYIIAGCTPSADDSSEGESGLKGEIEIDCRGMNEVRRNALESFFSGELTHKDTREGYWFNPGRCGKPLDLAIAHGVRAILSEDDEFAVASLSSMLVVLNSSDEHDRSSSSLVLLFEPVHKKYCRAVGPFIGLLRDTEYYTADLERKLILNGAMSGEIGMMDGYVEGANDGLPGYRAPIALSILQFRLQYQIGGADWLRAEWKEAAELIESTLTAKERVEAKETIDALSANRSDRIGCFGAGGRLNQPTWWR